MLSTLHPCIRWTIPGSSPRWTGPLPSASALTTPRCRRTPLTRRILLTATTLTRPPTAIPVAAVAAPQARTTHTEAGIHCRLQAGTLGSPLITRTVHRETWTEVAARPRRRRRLLPAVATKEMRRSTTAAAASSHHRSSSRR